MTTPSNAPDQPKSKTIAELEVAARSRMDATAYDYFAGAAGDERTLVDNQRAFDRIAFRPRMLVDVTRVDLRCTLLDTPLALPVLLAPDVLKALACGARAVLVGRPYLWGLAAEGEAGVRQVLERLRDEIELAMALAGCPTLADVDRSLVCAADRSTLP